MSIPKKVLDYLKNNKVIYETIEHKTVYTAVDAARTQHLSPALIMKTLVMKLDKKEYALACLPANKRLDEVKFKKIVNVWQKKMGKKEVKEIDFAKEAWMKKNVLGKVGATPPFGGLLKLPIFVDSAILENPKIIVNSGDYNYSLKLSSKAFEKLEKPIKGTFGKTRKE